MRTLSLEQLASLTLDDVVGRRDLGRVRLATPEELETLVGETGGGIAKGTIRNWRPIAIETEGKLRGVFIVGARGAENYGTSVIVAIEKDMGRVKTNSGSLYELEEAGEGEPPHSHVLHICAVLTHWGAGRILDVPEVFY